MMKYLLLTFLISEGGIVALAQANIVPSELSSILIQLPVVGLFAWYVLHTNKQNREWLSDLLETQDKRHYRTIELIEKIIERISVHQNQTVEQLAINTATVNESMRLGELREALEKLATKE